MGGCNIIRKTFIAFCLKCVRGGHKCSWWWPCSSFFVCFRLFFCTCGSLPSLPRPLDVWIVAAVVTACIFVRVARMFGWWWGWEGYGVSTQLLASFRRETQWEELLLECMERVHSGSVQYSSPLSYSSDVFPGFSDVVGEDVLKRAFLTVHRRHSTDVHDVFVEVSWLAFGGEDVFAVVGFQLANIRSFVAASWYVDAPSHLQLFFQRVS